MADSKMATEVETIKVRDAKGQLLMFTGTESFTQHMKDFTAAMNRAGHGEILQENDDGRPMRPDDAYARRANGIQQHGDTREISEYVRAKKVADTSAEIVLASFKITLGSSVISHLSTVLPDLELATKDNVWDIIDEVRLRFGGWTPARGNRNYHEMEMIPIFLSIQKVESGLLSMKALVNERAGWNDPRQLYDDTHYREWLESRIQDWSELHFLKNNIASHPAWTYTDCKVQLLQVVKGMQEQQNKLALQREQFQSMQAMQASINQDSSSVSHQPAMIQSSSNQWMASPGVSIDQQHATTNVVATGIGSTFVCYNCGQAGHYLFQCQELFHSRCYNNNLPYDHSVQQCTKYKSYPPRQYRTSSPSQRTQSPSTLQGSQKRTYQQTTQSAPPTKQQYRGPGVPPVPPVRSTGYPPRGTGPPAQTSSGSHPCVQPPRGRFTGSCVDIMAEVDANGEDPDAPEVLQAMFTALQAQMAQAEVASIGIPEDADWNPSTN